MFSVVVGPGGEERVRVLRGVVEVRATGRRGGPPPFLVFAGQEGAVGASEPTAIARAELKRDLALLLGANTMEMADWLAAVGDETALPLAPASAVLPATIAITNL